MSEFTNCSICGQATTDRSVQILYHEKCIRKLLRCIGTFEISGSVWENNLQIHKRKQPMSIPMQDDLMTWEGSQDPQMWLMYADEIENLGYPELANGYRWCGENKIRPETHSPGNKKRYENGACFWNRADVPHVGDGDSSQLPKEMFVIGMDILKKQGKSIKDDAGFLFLESLDEAMLLISEILKTQKGE